MYDFWVESTDTLAIASPLVLVTSVADLAEISLRSPRKLFIFIIGKKYLSIKASQKTKNIYKFEEKITARRACVSQDLIGMKNCNPVEPGALCG